MWNVYTWGALGDSNPCKHLMHRSSHANQVEAMNATHEILRGYYDSSRDFAGQPDEGVMCTFYYSRGRVVGMVVESA